MEAEEKERARTISLTLREESYYDVYVFVCLLTSFEIIPGLRDHALRIIIEISV